MQNTFLNLHFKYSSPWHFKRPFPRSFFECCMPFCQEEKKQKKTVWCYKPTHGILHVCSRRYLNLSVWSRKSPGANWRRVKAFVIILSSPEAARWAQSFIIVMNVYIKPFLNWKPSQKGFHHFLKCPTVWRTLGGNKHQLTNEMQELLIHWNNSNCSWEQASHLHKPM